MSSVLVVSDSSINNWPISVMGMSVPGIFKVLGSVIKIVSIAMPPLSISAIASITPSFDSPSISPSVISSAIAVKISVVVDVVLGSVLSAASCIRITTAERPSIAVR